MRRVVVATGFLLALGSGPSAARAAIETIELGGTITSLEGTSGEPPPEWQFVTPGETRFSATLVLDPAAADEDPDPELGSYPMTGPPHRFELAIGPFGFSTETFGLGVRNDRLSFFGHDSQSYSAHGVWGSGPLAPFAGLLAIGFGSGLSDDTAIASDEIVAASALLDTFSQRTLWIQSCGSVDFDPFPHCSIFTANVFGTVDTVQVVPEAAPARAGGMAVAALALLAARPRRFVARALAVLGAGH
jgi:hypothetical protein